MEQLARTTLLGKADPAPTDVINDDCASDIVLLCEHAGRAIPQSLGTLGISVDMLNSHRGWDIGAEEVARALSERLQAPLVVQRYSRLVVDCNRPPGGDGSIPSSIDNVEIPGNLSLSQSQKAERFDEILEPMNRALTSLFQSRRRATFSIHSFTPELDGEIRPWHAGFLTRKSITTCNSLMHSINHRHPDLMLALNKPYDICDETDWFIPRFAEPLELPHALIEIRNDQIDHPQGVAFWADTLAEAILELMEAMA